jgi:carbamoyl-phosphate synthase small subunit
MRAALVLENGRVFWGESLGALGEVKGEVVFNTGMTGYQEVLTDPSYAGQLVAMTYPLVGNYGLNTEDDQSRKIQVSGFIVKEDCVNPSNWRSKGSLNESLEKAGIVGIKGIDTRALTRVLRVHGTLKAMITNRPEAEIANLVAELQAWEPEKSLVNKVGTKEAYKIAGPGPKVVVMDFGIKENILESLKNKGFDLVVVPGDTPAEDILRFGPEGLFLSNGPGDPKHVCGAVDTIRCVADKLPIFAICLGHQLLCLALGGDTYKLKFGHRGSNQPVQDLSTGRVYITSQNHGYAVDYESLLETPLRVSHINLNDKTVEGMEHAQLPVFSVQYHPEAGPGPNDSLYLFDKFADNMKRGSA